MADSSRSENTAHVSILTDETKNNKRAQHHRCHAGPYILGETLGKGGLATVKVGVDSNTGSRVAVKIIEKDRLSNTREQISMAREITIMKVLKHKNVLRLYDVYENEDKIFLIIDLHDGGDLYSYLIGKGALRPYDALPLFRQIIYGLEYCHYNLIVHRDLKPENILLSRDRKSLVISDFGLSTGMAGSRQYLKTRCGTVHYISPEVAKGDPYIGMASDIWACGIILYALVTASLPFDGENSIAVLKRIVKGDYSMPAYLPSELQDLIRRLLDGNPEQRITIPQIKKHPWFRIGYESEPEIELLPPPPLKITLEDINSNKDIITNLLYLGWNEDELISQLLSDDNNEDTFHAKMFYHLLLKNRSKPISTIKGKTAEMEKAELHSPDKSEKTEKLDYDSDRSPSCSPSVSPSVSPMNSPRQSPHSANQSPTASPTISPSISPHRPRGPLNLKMSAPSTRRRAPSVDTKPEEVRNIIIRRRSSKKSQEKHIASKSPAESPPPSEKITTATISNSVNNSTKTTTTTASRARASTIDSPMRAPLAMSHGPLTRNTGNEALGPTKRSTDAPPGSSGWVHSPSTDRGSKIYAIHSKKDIGQILENLKFCFNDMSLEVVEKKSKTSSLKVKGKLAATRAGKNVVKVNIQTAEDGTTSLEFKKSGKSSRDEFQGVIKKVEETLTV